jgi:hypothetical protein
MIKVEVYNEVTDEHFEGKFETMGQAEAWINQQSEKDGWGKGRREMKQSEMSEQEKQRVLTKEKIKNRWVCQVKADYIISIYKDSDYKEKRRQEYPSWDEVMEAIVENMELRPEKLEVIKMRREQVKNKYPKDEKELLERR